MAILTLHSVNPTGMFSYGSSGNLPLLNKGLIHLKGINEDKGGDSNGAGKSSLFNVICELLFQENPTKVKGDEVINSVWGKGMAGRLIFTTSDNVHYRITYCRKWKEPYYEVDNDNSISYVGNGLFLDRYDSTAQQWIDYRGATMADTKSRIQEIIGLTYNNFLAISFLSPRVGDTFTISNNPLLTNLNGLGSLTSLGGSLIIEGNAHKQ